MKPRGSARSVICAARAKPRHPLHACRQGRGPCHCRLNRASAHPCGTLLANGAATRAETTRLLGVAYLNYATEQLPVYRQLIDLILEDERRPLLFHCSAGKDRTGLGAALILTALGVSRDQILADYVATDRFWRRDHPLPDEAPQEAKDAILDTHPALLAAALEAAVAPFGSEAGLLEDGLGLTPARLVDFRAVLLD
ncbi:MAG: tyrosine-protein phosphatase [Roseomonas sp.]|nr:tyrosine-protein phosphatase [Roseomonas sp.]